MLRLLQENSSSPLPCPRGMVRLHFIFNRDGPPSALDRIRDIDRDEIIGNGLCRLCAEMEVNYLKYIFMWHALVSVNRKFTLRQMGYKDDALIKIYCVERPSDHTGDDTDDTDDEGGFA